MKNTTHLASMAAVLLLCSCTYGQIIVNSGGDARVFTSNTTANGGNTNSGALIGLNTGGVDNVLLHDFSNLSALAGQTVTGATLTAGIAVGFTNANHGSTADIITLNEIAIGNAGWIQGTSAVTAGSATDGSVSWDFQSTTGDGNDVQWVDASGASVGNILGAFSTVATTPGYDQGTGGNPPLDGNLTFNIGAATAQDWVDNGLAGLALHTNDDGDSRSRFNFLQPDFWQIEFTVEAVPEPSTGIVVLLAGLLGLKRRRR